MGRLIKMKDKPQSAISRIGNLVINTHGSRKDVIAWTEIKEYIHLLESKLRKVTDA